MAPNKEEKITSRSNRFLDLTNKTFGSWTVLHRNIDKCKNHGISWVCLCACGVQKIVQGTALNKGRSLSCGCTRPNTFKKMYHGGSVGANSIVSNYRCSASRRGYSFELTHSECYALFSENCYWCGAPPNNYITEKKSGIRYKYNGLDRVDNSLGYTQNNVVSCCSVCNRAKGTLTSQEFVNWIIQITKFHTEGQKLCSA